MLRIKQHLMLFSVPRLVIGAVYKHLGEMMKLLWGKDLKMNTIHVTDLCRAIWHLALRDDTLSQIYNVVDRGDTTQGMISNLVSEIFNINHDYWFSINLSLCKVSNYLDFTVPLSVRFMFSCPPGVIMLQFVT
jgi:nucleoside-diphosphate-sugar epimerase